MFWMTAFVDLAPDEFDRGVEFWRGVTGYDLSPVRGDHDEFATLVPPEGDAHLRVQRLGDGPSRVHIDLHVTDPAAAADEAVALGATVVTRHPTYAVLTSPGGFEFCFERQALSRPAAPADWGGGLTSVVDQVCLDVPEPAYETEFGFWRALTGWEEREVARAPGVPPADPPARPAAAAPACSDWRSESGPVRAHFDLAASDQQTEVERHRALGASVAWFGDGWTVMAAPAGPAYCITGRSPGMRVLDVPVSR